MNYDRDSHPGTDEFADESGTIADRDTDPRGTNRDGHRNGHSDAFTGAGALRPVVSRADYFARIARALAGPGAGYWTRDDHADRGVMRLRHRAALRGHFGIRPDNPPFRGDRAAAAVAGRRAGCAAASSVVSWS